MLNSVRNFMSKIVTDSTASGNASLEDSTDVVDHHAAGHHRAALPELLLDRARGMYYHHLLVGTAMDSVLQHEGTTTTAESIELMLRNRAVFSRRVAYSRVFDGVVPPTFDDLFAGVVQPFGQANKITTVLPDKVPYDIFTVQPRREYRKRPIYDAPGRIRLEDVSGVCDEAYNNSQTAAPSQPGGDPNLALFPRPCMTWIVDFAAAGAAAPVVLGSAAEAAAKKVSVNDALKKLRLEPAAYWDPDNWRYVKEKDPNERPFIPKRPSKVWDDIIRTPVPVSSRPPLSGRDHLGSRSRFFGPPPRVLGSCPQFSGRVLDSVDRLCRELSSKPGAGFCEAWTPLAPDEDLFDEEDADAGAVLRAGLWAGDRAFSLFKKENPELFEEEGPKLFDDSDDRVFAAAETQAYLEAVANFQFAPREESLDCSISAEHAAVGGPLALMKPWKGSKEDYIVPVDAVAEDRFEPLHYPQDVVDDPARTAGSRTRPLDWWIAQLSKREDLLCREFFSTAGDSINELSDDVWISSRYFQLFKIKPVEDYFKREEVIVPPLTMEFSQTERFFLFAKPPTPPVLEQSP